jgi:hypothetical protein
VAESAVASQRLPLLDADNGTPLDIAPAAFSAVVEEAEAILGKFGLND